MCQSREVLKDEVENGSKKVDVSFRLYFSQVSFFFSCTVDLKKFWRNFAFGAGVKDRECNLLVWDGLDNTVVL